MRREEFEHVVRAAAEEVGELEFIVVGSQAILGSHPDAPETMLRSMEADMYPRRAPEKAIQIDGSIGDGSQFHRSFGYYGHAVGPETISVPKGWEARLVKVEVQARVRSELNPVAYCLEVHDLVLAKCARGEQRDWDFAREALLADLVTLDELEARLEGLPVEAAQLATIKKMLVAIAR